MAAPVGWKKPRSRCVSITLNQTKFGEGIKLKFAKAVGSVLLLLLLGLPFPWAFSMTMNRVIPSITIHKNSSGYTSAMFVVEKTYYNPGKTGKYGSWSADGLVNDSIPTTIGSGGHYNYGDQIKDDADLSARFPAGKRLEILFNPNAPRGQQVLNLRENFPAYAAGRIKFWILLAYGPLVIEFMAGALLWRFWRHRKEKLSM